MMYSNLEEEEFTFKYYNYNNDEIIDLSNIILFIKDMHLNDAIDPYIMTNELPLSYSLYDAYPNPFNPVTNIKYSLADDVDNLKINIYDVRGRIVEKLYNGKNNKGIHQIKWDASYYASGIYFVYLKTKNHKFVKKIMLIK